MSKRTDEPPQKTEGDEEKRFLDKVEREIGLPDYSLFSGSGSMGIADHSRLRGDGDAIRLCHCVEHCLATRPCLRLVEQLHRAPKRRIEDMQACSPTYRGSCRDHRLVA
jgi:hypothetical protein